MSRENEVGELSNGELLERLETMSSSERLLGAAIVEHLCEVEARGLHLDIGFGSLFQYCTKQLGFSEDVAYKRVKVAQAGAARPRILEHLETGELSLSSVAVIASHLDEIDQTETRADLENLVVEDFSVDENMTTDMNAMDQMPFDGSRMMWGGFTELVSVRAD